jgi:glutamine amidotransferase
MIGIVNYGSGNIAAIANILAQSNIAFKVVDSHTEIGSADKYILPGVGLFDETLKTLSSSGMMDVLQENVVVKGKPILGICVGMQILSNKSDEGSLPGFGWIQGDVLRMRKSDNVRTPHMGWNSIAVSNDQAGLLKDVDVARGFYFLHSYHFVPSQTKDILAECEYGDRFCCGVSNGTNVFGVQFHPEKSHNNGVLVFKNFDKISI